jgi:methionyl-tRNA synthetase
MTTTYLTTTIPYVNAAPHLGHALEAVQADVFARQRRLLGDDVRLLSGTDDNSLKNVLAAEAAGQDVQAFVDANAAKFEQLQGALNLTYDDFIRTSTDPRHRRGVEALWRACRDDFYQDRYDGLYCVGCEHYITEDRCPEHREPPHRLAEENWFFRLSKYQGALHDAITTGVINIEPEARRNEVLAFVAGGLRDFSVSRSRHRARGWGIPVPDDPEQVIYVWWDALANYVSSLNYPDGDDFQRWWVNADQRIHFVGKGVLRFHAVYWPAILLSAGLPLPTDIVVHDYLTVNGQKISKSAGTSVDPVTLTEEYGTDAVRWWLLRDVPRVGDADFTEERLRARHDADLAGGVGNLVNRVVTLIHKSGIPEITASAASDPGADAATILKRVEHANRSIEQHRPWESRQGQVLADLLQTCQVIGRELEPFVPELAARVTRQCTVRNGSLPPARPIAPRLAPAAAGSPRAQRSPKTPRKRPP